MIGIALGEHAYGEHEAAVATLATAEALTETVIARAVSARSPRPGGLATAEALIETVIDGRARVKAFLALAQAEVILGETDRASSLLQDAFDRVRQAQGNAQAAGDVDIGFAGLLGVEDGPIGVVSLSEIARLYKHLNDQQRFLEAVELLYDSAVATIARRGGPDRPRGDLRVDEQHAHLSFDVEGAEAGLALAILDQCEKALDIAARLRPYERHIVYDATIQSFVRQRDWDRALAVVDKIDQAHRESETVVRLGAADEPLIAISGGLARRQLVAGD